MTKKKISILGSTGSIGVQTLEVAKNLGLEVCALTANSNVELLYQQAIEFKPRLISVTNHSAARELRERLNGLHITVLYGLEGLITAATIEEVDTVVTAIVGIAGLLPTIHAIRNGKNIALANKETLVTAGQLVMEEARKNNVNIFPVDSEHSAIFQCLMGNNIEEVEKIILTASGGPFRGKKLEELKEITKEQALNHPNWKMGSKITIDSATLMNKGLEIIEAKWLFNLELDKIQVVIHPQSIIHSMVEYRDGAVMAQMGTPDMKLPIQLALTYPKRIKSNSPKLDFINMGSLTFLQPDIKTFKCLGLAVEASKIGGTMPVVLNGVNEVAVNLFLQEKIKFLQIQEMIEIEMGKHNIIKNPSLDDIIAVDKEIREKFNA